MLTLALVDGMSGPEAIGNPDRHRALQEVGRLGSALQSLQVQTLLRELPGRRSVLVHGDFGLQNLLFDRESLEIVVLLDCEFAHSGNPIEDIAWAEWIVRVHCPGAMNALDDLHEGYGTVPPWSERHEPMLGIVRNSATPQHHRRQSEADCETTVDVKGDEALDRIRIRAAIR